MSSEIIPDDPIARALALLKQLPDKISFELSSTYTSDVPIHLVRHRVRQLRQFDDACRQAGYEVKISYSNADPLATQYDLVRKKKPDGVIDV